MCCCVETDGGNAAGAVPSWAQTLVVGRVSGATNPQITNGQVVELADAGLVVRGELAWTGAEVRLRARNTGAAAVAGDAIMLEAGPGGGVSGAGGLATVRGGTTTLGAGGGVVLEGRNGAGAGNNAGGNVTVIVGTATGVASPGRLAVVPNWAGDTNQFIELAGNGANSATTGLYTGDRDPNAVVSAAPGSTYMQSALGLSTLWVNVSLANPGTVWMAASGAGATPTWAQTLAVGRISGGTNPQITDGDVFELADGAATVRGEMFWTTATTFMTIRALNDGTGAAAGDNLEVLAGDGAGAGGVGGALFLNGGAGGTTGAVGGDINILAGAGGSVSGGGGSIAITAGVPVEGGGGQVVITASDAATTGAVANPGGAIALQCGNATTSSVGGSCSIDAGGGGLTGTAGTIDLRGGPGGATSGAGGAITLTGGLPTDGAGGGITLTGAAGATVTAAARAGGTVTITAGASVSGGTGGSVNITSGAGGGGGTPGSVVLTSPFNVDFESTFFTRFNPTSGSAEIIYGNDTCKLCVNSLSDINGLITATPGSEHIADNGAAANYRGLLYNKAGTGNTGWIPKSQPARVSTADATVTTVWAYTLVDNSAVKVKANLVAMQDTGANRKVFEINIFVYRDGGVATVEGVVFDSFVPYGSAGFALATATLDVDGAGNDVRLRVTGIAATNIVWTAQIELDESR